MISQDTSHCPLTDSTNLILVKEAKESEMAAQEIELPNVVEEKSEPEEQVNSPVLEVNCVSNTEQTSETQPSEAAKTETDLTDNQATNGVTNPVFLQEDHTIEESIPGLTYVDFLPQKIHEDYNIDPTYSDFSSLVEVANDWLTKNTEYSLWKCETVTFKVNNDWTTDQDNPLYMESAYGITRFLHGLRLWLVPQLNTSMPVSQIGFTTALPGKQEDNGCVRPSANSTIQDLTEELNKQFQRKPLPGIVLNIEQIEFHENETTGSQSIDPNRTFWKENGSENIVKVSALRIFFILGKSENGRIGYHDELPDILHTAFASSVRFGPFKNVVKKMGAWLKFQKGKRIVHLQSVNTLVNFNREALAYIDPSQCYYIERSGIESRYAKVLRAFYITTKSEESPYQSINLNTRLFTPVQKEGKNFESVSKTMQRTIKWLDYTRVPPFSVETVQHQVYLGGETVGNLEDKVDKNVRRSNGRYQLSTFRMYFPSEFIEPPPEIAPEVDTAAGWGCVVS